MKLSFDPSKKYIVFYPESQSESNVLSNFPGLWSVSIYKVCPAVPPVAFNVIERLKDKTKLSIPPDIQALLDTDFVLKSLPKEFYYHTSPMKFQDIALRYLYTLESAGLLLDPGMGKSKVALDYIFLRKFNKVCIVCPKPLMFVWEDEIARHRPELSFYSVQSTDWGEEKEGIQNACVTIINYNKVVTFKHQLKKVGYEFIHLDEFLIKDPGTQRTQAITELSYHIPNRCGGSGTLVNNTPLDVFAPVRFLQPALVGSNLTNFKKEYVVEAIVKRPGSTDLRMEVGFRKQDEVKEILESCCIVMTKEEWLDLPKKTFIDIDVPLSLEQREYYYSLLRNYRVEIPSKAGPIEVEVDNALTMLSKLYQIANGFVYTSEETEDEILDELLDLSPETKKAPKRITTFFEEQPKIDALRKLLTETLHDRKAILWFNMTAELELIEKLVKELGHEYLTIKGGDKKIGDKVRTFNKTPSIRWLICQAKSVNYGITVLGSKKKDLEDSGVEILPGVDPAVFTEVFFSLNFSLEVYLQQCDRVHRLGQNIDCEYYRLFSKTPVDRKIKEAMETKLQLRREMLVDVAKTLLASKEEDEIQEDSIL